MRNVDYAQNDYHEKRHPEFLANDLLFHAWGAFAKHVYFEPLGFQGKRILEYGGALGYNLIQIKDEAHVIMLEPSKR